MAVQIPDPGTGNGQTGDNEYVFRSKVRDNFADQNNAASREVGKGVGQVASTESYGVNGLGWGASSCFPFDGTSLSDISESGLVRTPASLALDVGAPVAEPSLIMSLRYFSTYLTQVIYTQSTSKPRAFLRSAIGAVVGEWYELYSTANTQLDSNGALKPSSPVLRVFNDRIEGNADGDTMAATYTKNGVGDYTITGTTGLRTDGWYIVIPNDMNGNPKVAVTLDDTDGVITLKTYARIFDMTTFKFAPDLNQPLDIPDGRWIDLRFNDLPAEPMPEV